MKTKNLIAAVLISAGLAVGTAAQGAGKETKVQLENLPLAVQKAIKSKAGTDKVVRIERESANGKDVYEAIVSKNGKEQAIQVDDTGHFLGMHDEAAEHGKTAEKTTKH